MRISAVVLAGVLVAGAGTTGCSSSVDIGIQSDPLLLVGSWQVTAPGERPGTALILGPGLTLFRRCGELFGSWDADHSGAFVGESFGGSQNCFIGPHPAPNVSWLKAAVGFRVARGDRLLLDDQGHVVARLTPGAHPTAGPDSVSTIASPPSITSALKKRFAEPTSLPGSMRPASPSDAVGRWRAIGKDAGGPKAFIRFKSSGEWTGSDGCNGAGGRYAIGPGGEMIAISGDSTAVGCDNSPAPYWVPQTRRVSIDDGQLVLFDSRGHLLGRLTRQA